ncbi:hypothetical protein I3842_09G189800 [Carya illinoinensis]|uniref:Uncharacterized protein n=1 Tax=Carya illinoinensis TaxID=32201 RepID=A0A922E5N9_CARIL|nr:hypothetical protein I3842_09G189800 [Carya illinoinensis]
MVKQRSLTPRGAPRANKQNHQSRSKTPDSNSRRNPLRNIPQKTIQNSQGSRPKPQPRTSPPTEKLSAQLGVKKKKRSRVTASGGSLRSRSYFRKTNIENRKENTETVGRREGGAEAPPPSDGYLVSFS